MPTMDEYLAMMQPDPEANRKARIFQALGGLGAGLLGGGGWQRGLARGGLLAHDAMNDTSNRASSDQMAQFKMRMTAQEMADRDSAREGEAQFGKQLAAITSTAPRLNNMGTGGPTPANAAAVAPPDRVERLRQGAEFYAQNNKPDQAKKYFDAADAMEGTFSVDPKVGLGPDGKPQFGQFSNKGRDPRIAQGFTPPPDLQAVNLGDKTQFVDKLTTAPGATFAAGMSPDAKARNAVDWANINDRRAREKSEGATAGAGGVAAADKPLTESQGTAALYYGMMRAASKDLASLDQKKLTTGSISAARGDVPYVPDAILSMVAGPEAQKYNQASLQWTEAMLRATTGATAPPEEVKRTAKTFFPQMGDSKDVIDQKNARREDMERLMAIKAGASGTSQVSSALGSTGQPKTVKWSDLP